MKHEALIELQEERELISRGLGATRYYNNKESSDFGDTKPGRALMLARKDSATPDGERLNLVEKFSEVIRDMLKRVEEGRAGAGRPTLAHSYLKMLQPEPVAYIVVRTVLTSAIRGDKLTAVCMRIGRAIEDQYRFDELMVVEPALGHSAVLRASTRPNAAHRHTIMRGAANIANVTGLGFAEGDMLKLGNKLVEMFIASWHVKTDDGDELWIHAERDPAGDNRTIYRLACNPKMTDWLKGVDEALSLIRPKFMPMLVKPRDWTDVNTGGYLTTACRVPFIRQLDTNLRDDLMSNEMPDVFRAVNGAQSTAWTVNTAVLSLMDVTWRNGEDLGGIPAADPEALPPRPADITRELRVADMTVDQALRFKDWRIAAAKVHESNARLSSKRLSLMTQLRMAKELAVDEEFYFPHNVDFRGRLYSIVPELNPQSDDLGKALLMFAEGKPLGDNGGFWLAVHIANLFGYDKVSFEDRVAWVQDNSAKLLDSARDPLDGQRFWCGADSPWQALAACIEWDQTDEGSNKTAVTRLPIAMDGSCSGLQHFSAMLLDSEGAQAVNLCNNVTPSDIYTQVQMKTEELLLEMTDNVAYSWRNKVSRKIVKRPCMTFAYSVTSRGIRDQILDELTKTGGQHLPGWENFEAASYLAPIVEQAIRLTVERAAEAMDWLKASVKLLLDCERPVIWSTPTGFIVHQRYQKSVGKHFKVYFQGKRVRLTLRIQGEKPDTRKQASAVAPNFVHSMDAAHLQMVVNRMRDEGITTSFSVIHDSFGVHACDVDELHYAIRDEFVKLYSTSQLDKYRNWVLSTLPADKRELMPPAPDAGTFNIEEVRNADFFFA